MNNFQVVIGELQHFLFSPGDDTISILCFADNACDEGGQKKFVVLETKRSIEMTGHRAFLRSSAR